MSLPTRDVSALVEALRVRALALTGEAWERNATRDMMKEAAEQLDALTRRCGELEQRAVTVERELANQVVGRRQFIADALRDLQDIDTLRAQVATLQQDNADLVKSNQQLQRKHDDAVNAELNAHRSRASAEEQVATLTDDLRTNAALLARQHDRNIELETRIATLERELAKARENLNNSCACRHDGRGGLDSECQEHAEQRQRAEEAERQIAAIATAWTRYQHCVTDAEFAEVHAELSALLLGRKDVD